MRGCDVWEERIVMYGKRSRGDVIYRERDDVGREGV